MGPQCEKQKMMREHKKQKRTEQKWILMIFKEFQKTKTIENV